MISQEIQSLLDNGTIRVTKPGLGFVNNIFLVPKSGQRWKLILNLKVLNSYTVSKYFKIEVPGAYTLLGKPMVIYYCAGNASWGDETSVCG